MKNMQEHREDFRYRPAEVGKMVEVRVTYMKDVRRRGVYIVVQPMEVKQENGYTTEAFLLFSGFSMLAEECARKTPKLVKAVAEMVDGLAVEVATIFATEGKEKSQAWLKDRLQEWKDGRIISGAVQAMSKPKAVEAKDTECGSCGTDHDSRKECPAGVRQ